MKNVTFRLTIIALTFILVTIGITYLGSNSNTKAFKNNPAQATPGEKQLNTYINKGKPSIILFTSQYCRDCIEVKPIINKLETLHKDKINFLTIDVQKTDALGEAAINKYKVFGVPFVVFIKKDGTLQKSFIGSRTEDTYKQQLELLLRN